MTRHRPAHWTLSASLRHRILRAPKPFKTRKCTPHSHRSLTQATKDFMVDIVHFFVYRWPYLCLTSPEKFSVEQTPKSGIAEAGLTGIGVLGGRGAEHSLQVLGALL